MRIARPDGSGLAINDDTGAFHPLAGVSLGSGVRWAGGTMFVIDDRGIARCAPTCSQVLPERPRGPWAASPEGLRIHVAEWIIDGTGTRQATPAREGAWLDRDRIVYTVGDQLWLWNARSNATTRLGAPAPFPEKRALVPSPDGKLVAAIGRREEQLSLGRKASHYGFALFDIAGARWEPYGESTQPDRGLLSSALGDPVWAPSSRRLAYLDELEMMVVDVAHPAPRPLHHPVESVLGWIDDHRVAVMHLQRSDASMVRRYGHGRIETWCDLGVIDVDTGREVLLTSNGAFVGCSAVFSRSGT